MNQKMTFFRIVILLALFTFLGSSFAQNSSCELNGYIEVIIIHSGSIECVPEEIARYWVANGTAVRTQDLIIDSETASDIEGAVAQESCKVGHIKVMLINGEQSFCAVKHIAEQWIADKLAVEIDDEEKLSAINTPQGGPEHLCEEGLIQAVLSHSGQIVCTSRDMAERWLLTGFVNEIRIHPPSVSYPCKSDRHIQAIMIHDGTRVCALELTVRSWERQGLAIRASTIAIPPEMESNTVELKKCEGKYVRVKLVWGTPAFCVSRNIADRWINEKLAFEVDGEEEKPTVTNSP